MNIFTDGASKGNPGKAGIGVVAFSKEVSLAEFKESNQTCDFFFAEPIGAQTNNFAEYSAFIAALKIAAEKKLGNLNFLLDSELIVKQVNGIYKVKNKNIQPLFFEAMELIRPLENIKVSHVRRESNQVADYLANQAILEQKVLSYGL